MKKEDIPINMRVGPTGEEWFDSVMEALKKSIGGSKELRDIMDRSLEERVAELELRMMALLAMVVVRHGLSDRVTALMLESASLAELPVGEAGKDPNVN